MEGKLNSGGLTLDDESPKQLRRYIQFVTSPGSDEVAPPVVEGGRIWMEMWYESVYICTWTTIQDL